MLVDTHCHLDFADFADDLPGLITRARNAGVTRMVTISTRVRRFAAYAALAENHPEIWCTVGTHPHQAGEEDGISADEIVDLASHPRCVGIGEAGLDYHYDKAPRDAQARGLRVHIEAARRTGLPLVIHARNADADMETILRDEMGQGRFSAILHCFSSGSRLAQVGVELGLYVSFSGILTFKTSDELRAIARTVPLDRLLVETDAPYLAPAPYRGKRNEPAYVAETARVLATVKDVSIGEIAHITTANALRCYWKIEGRGTASSSATTGNAVVA
jgi:TatD DNase family protein